jgi:hypothetical protein
MERNPYEKERIWSKFQDLLTSSTVRVWAVWPLARMPGTPGRRQWNETDCGSAAECGAKHPG